MESPNNVIKNFTCEICEKTFSTNNSKDKHISTVHGEVKKFECNIYSKPFGLKHELMSHVENNHQAKDQKCKFCAKMFSNFGRLSQHITKIHEAQRNYKCDYCGKSFSQSGITSR